jgi:hypothetical protein
MLLDPDPVPHSQYESGSRTAKCMWIRIHNTEQENGKLGLRDCLINYNKDAEMSDDCKQNGIRITELARVLREAERQPSRCFPKRRWQKHCK